MERIGKYEIVDVLGQGGMGVVYRARDPRLNRDVAIKVIHDRAIDVPRVRERFYREARSAGALQHENVTAIFDVGDEDGTPYLVMELLDGSDLRAVLDDAPPLATRLDLAAQVCMGLGYAHSRGIVHRDIKPENVRVTSTGRAKILDFGIARIESEEQTMTQASLGTPRYMSPEQIRGGAVDHRTDIFSFGVLFYELLTGVSPFDGEHITTVITRVLHEEPEPIHLANPVAQSELQAIVSKCLAKEPADRYATCYEVADAIRQVHVAPEEAAPKTKQTLFSRLPWGAPRPPTETSVSWTEGHTRQAPPPAPTPPTPPPARPAAPPADDDATQFIPASLVPAATAAPPPADALDTKTALFMRAAMEAVPAVPTTPGPPAPTAPDAHTPTGEPADDPNATVFLPPSAATPPPATPPPPTPRARRKDDARRPVAPEPTPRPAARPSAGAPASRRGLVVGGGVALLLVLAVVGWSLRGEPDATAVDAPVASVSTADPLEAAAQEARGQMLAQRDSAVAAGVEGSSGFQQATTRAAEADSAFQAGGDAGFRLAAEAHQSAAGLYRSARQAGTASAAQLRQLAAAAEGRAQAARATVAGSRNDAAVAPLFNRAEAALLEGARARAAGNDARALALFADAQQGFQTARAAAAPAAGGGAARAEASRSRTEAEGARSRARRVLGPNRQSDLTRRADAQWATGNARLDGGNYPAAQAAFAEAARLYADAVATMTAGADVAGTGTTTEGPATPTTPAADPQRSDADARQRMAETARGRVPAANQSHPMYLEAEQHMGNARTYYAQGNYGQAITLFGNATRRYESAAAASAGGGY